MPNFLEEAISVARLGYQLFPCVPNGKMPFSSLASKGCNSATKSELLIANWWASQPECNIGLKCKKCLVVDVDCKDGKNGHEDLLDVVRQLGSLPDGPLSMTPSGGCHLFFARPDAEIIGKTGVLWQGKATGIDIRVGNQYVVIPPSQLVSDKRITQYTWKTPLLPIEKLPELPSRWIEEFLPNRQRHQELVIPHKLPTSSSGRVILPGDHIGRCREYLARVDPCIAGQGGDEQLFKASCVVFWDFGLSQREGMSLLQEYNARCQPPWPQSRLDYKMNQALSFPRHEKPRGHKLEEQKPLENYGVDLSQFSIVPAPLVQTVSKAEHEPEPMPEKLLYVPGFVHDVAEFSLRGAPHPNPQIATLGALACQSFLAARKVRSALGSRSSIYLLALAGSGTGKEYPRLVNQHILSQIGLQSHLVETCASGEGLEDLILIKQSLLMQTDEFNFMLTDFAKGVDSRFRSLESLILRLYSASSGGSFTGRVKAGKEVPLTVREPGLTILGTATRQRFCRALTVDMIEGGLVSRCIVVETNKRSYGQRKREVSEISDDILEIAKFWCDFTPVDPATGKVANLNSIAPSHLIIPVTPKAESILEDFGHYADDQTVKYSQKNDVTSILWTRVYEAAGRLAVIYACSRNHREPVIDHDTARWACEFSEWTCEQMNLMIKRNLAETAFHAIWLKIEDTIRNNGGHASQSLLINKLKINAKQLQEAIETMGVGQRIALVEIPTKGRSRMEYVLTDSTLD